MLLMSSGWLLWCSGCFRVFSVGVRVFWMFLGCKGVVRMLLMFLGLLACSL